MQVLPSLVAVGDGTAAARGPAPLTTFAQHLRSVRLGEGIRSLWRGVPSVILGAGPAHAAHFGMYEFVREIAGGREDGWKGVGGTALAGASATVTSDALMNPFDVIKQRMQIRGSPYASVMDCARKVYGTEGLAAFYVSYPTTLTMSVPFTAVQFTAYESLKSFLNPSGSYSPLTHVTAGGIAGGLAAAVTTPLDVAKTLLQTRGTSEDLRIRNARGMGEALRIIVERDGWKGLRRGMVPRVLTVAPSTAISWMSYEFFSEFYRGIGHSHTRTPGEFSATRHHPRHFRNVPSHPSYYLFANNIHRGPHSPGCPPRDWRNGLEFRVVSSAAGRCGTPTTTTFCDGGAGERGAAHNNRVASRFERSLLLYRRPRSCPGISPSSYFHSSQQKDTHITGLVGNAHGIIATVLHNRDHCIEWPPEYFGAAGGYSTLGRPVAFRQNNLVSFLTPSQLTL